MSKRRYISKTEGKFVYLRQILLQIKDENIPLDKKLKFVKIFSDKLNEFVSEKTSDDKKFKNFRKLYKKLLKIDKEFLNIYEEALVPAFKKEKIFIENLNSLNEDQLKSGNEFFDKNIKTVLTPFAINEDSIQSFFKDGQKYLVLKIENSENNINAEPEISSEKEEEAKYEYVLIGIPSSIPKLINLSSETTEIISVTDIIELNLQKILPERKIKDIYSFILRLDSETDNEWMLYAVNDNLPKETRKLLGIKKKNIFTELFYPQVLDLTSFLGNKFSLRENEVKTLTANALSKTSNIFEIISKQDILFYFPYHSNENIINLFQQVSNDPFVTEIKLTQSPLTQNPNIIVSLMNAVKNGKRVNIYADEGSDVNPLNDFRESGINIILNASGLQIDSETTLIKRRENDGEKNYVYFSTKNSSAGKNSTDISLLTSDSTIANDLNYFFNFLELGTKGFEFEELLVSGLNMRKNLASLIETEIENAKQGKDAFIMLKMNKLEDKKLINLLFGAGDSGVKIKLLISESCLLKPENWNENIQIKYLINTPVEHSKIFIFYNDGEPIIYISSLDWTKQSFSKKIGLAMPIKQTNLRTMLVELINLYSKNDKSAVYNYLAS